MYDCMNSKFYYILTARYRLTRVDPLILVYPPLRSLPMATVLTSVDLLDSSLDAFQNHFRWRLKGSCRR